MECEVSASARGSSTDTPDKSKHYDKSYKDFVKLKFCRDLTSAKSDVYDFKTALFEIGEPEEFLLLVRNFDMTLTASKNLKKAAKVQ